MTSSPSSRYGRGPSSQFESALEAERSGARTSALLIAFPLRAAYAKLVA